MVGRCLAGTAIEMTVGKFCKESVLQSTKLYGYAVSSPIYLPETFMKQILRSTMLLLALMFPLFAHAIGDPYTLQKFDELNKAGKPVLVAIHADWCGTCRAQEQVLKKLLLQPEFRGITALRVDFDKQKPAVHKFAARYQSTLIVFKDGEMVGRMTGETDSARIAGLLRSIL
jgi:thiol:disulfide interchange protein